MAHRGQSHNGDERNPRSGHAVDRASYARRQRVGLMAFALLMTAEIVEYVVGSTFTRWTWPVLAALAFVGAWPILQYFMHLPQLWHKDEEE